MKPEIHEKHLHLDREHFWRVAKRRLVLQFIERYYPHPKQLRILDVGSAASQIILDLQRHGVVTAVEPSEQAILLARERLGFDVLQGSLPSALPHGSYDLITVLDVLEHVKEDEAALRALKDRLAVGGLLICTVPAYQWLWSSHDAVLRHRRSNTRARLKTLFHKAGLEIDRLSYYTCFLLPLVAAQRAAWKVYDLAKENELNYRVRIPFKPINSALGMIMTLEQIALQYFDLPCGSALIAVATREL